jgi:lipopolysaccharide/colanic/teichoic acid biosynthesis glycosyltransferase
MGKSVQGGLKRTCDLALASALLVATLPTSIIALIATAIAQRGNPIVVARRAGRNGRTIGVLDMKTTRLTHDEMGQPLPACEQTTTQLGRFLRAAHIDQLPRLINVIAGQMSLVGPPPLPVSYLARYTAEQSRRLEMRPGVTGPSQLADHAVWDSRFSADVAYVDTWTLSLDLRILAATLGLMTADHTRAGVVPEFTGAPLPPPAPMACAQLVA